ncbi:MAG: dephospho-CoA kinase [Hyphomicrobiales bacterium]
MLILGLTGSIGMGKSTTARMFAAAGIPVHDADATVHMLYRGPAVAAIEAAFPGTTGPDGVDRRKLGAAVVGKPEAIARLEAIVHPLVREEERCFLRNAAESSRIAVLDIPLLFETGGAARVDAVVVVTADAAVQRARVLARPGMTEALLETMLARQMADADKRRAAHFIVDTGHGLDDARRAVADILRAVAGMRGKAAAAVLNGRGR